jgi:hypothetical protein
MSITFLLWAAGIAAALGRRGLARPAVLWIPVIAGLLMRWENSINATCNKSNDWIFLFDFVLVSPGVFNCYGMV